MSTSTHQPSAQQTLYRNLAIRDAYFFRHYLTQQIFTIKRKSIKDKKLFQQYLHHLWNSAAAEKNPSPFDHWLHTQTTQFCKYLS